MIIGMLSCCNCSITSKPVMPGIWISRNTRSGANSAIAASASFPFLHDCSTSIRANCSRRIVNPLRASDSSSTTIARIFCPSSFCFIRNNNRYFAAHRLAWRKCQFVFCTINFFETVTYVLQTHSTGCRAVALHHSRVIRNSRSVISHFDDELACCNPRTHLYQTTFLTTRDRVFDRILDQRLQQQTRHEGSLGIGGYI